MLQNPPIEGDYLQARKGEKIRLEFSLEPGKIPFIYTRLYLLTEVGVRPQWYAEGDGKYVTNYRCKVILAPRARDAVIQREGLLKPFVTCTQLKILRASLKGTALIAEVDQW